MEGTAHTKFELTLNLIPALSVGLDIGMYQRNPPDTSTLGENMSTKTKHVPISRSRYMYTGGGMFT